MGHDLQDTFVIRMQNILRIAHGLREATVTSDLTAYSLPRPSDSQPPVISIDSISLPSPPPLLPSLIEAGVSPEIASAASKIYLGRAEQLKQRIEESVTTAYCKVARIPASTSALSPDLLMKKVSLIFTEIYVQRLEKWKEESIQRIKRASTRPVKTAPRNSRTFNYVSAPRITWTWLLMYSAGLRPTIGALFRGKPISNACRQNIPCQKVEHAIQANSCMGENSAHPVVASVAYSALISFRIVVIAPKKRETL